MSETNLSIIIPHYNSPDTLEKLLNSIFSESGDDVEAIVVDDNSDKHPEEYAGCRDLFSHNRVRFLENNTKTKGAGACRNIGLENSAGKWVLFADADDYLTKGWYEYTSKYFQSDDDVIYFFPTSINLQTLNKGSREQIYLKLINDYLGGSRKGYYRLRYCFVVPWSKMIRKELIDKNNIRFDCTRYSNDVMFSVKVGYYLSTFCVDENTIYCVTEGSDTLTTNLSESVFFMRLQVFAEKYNFLREHLTKEEWDYLPTKNEPLRMLDKAVKRKYGLRFVCRCIRYLKEKKVSIISKDVFLFPFIWIKKKTGRYI